MLSTQRYNVYSVGEHWLSSVSSERCTNFISAKILIQTVKEILKITDVLQQPVRYTSIKIYVGWYIYLDY